MQALNNSQPVQRCKHISATGDLCYWPALRGRSRCYIHIGDIAPSSGTAPARVLLELPAIENPALIQAAIGQVLAARSEGKITPRRASLYIHALQIARQTVKQLRSIKNQEVEKRAE